MKENYYTIKRVVQSKVCDTDGHKRGGLTKEVDIELTEDEVRELASQLPEEREWLQLKDEDLPDPDLENAITYEPGDDTEQQKVSDCCGVEAISLIDDDKFADFHICAYCKEDCDAVEPVGHRTEATVKIDQEKVAEAIDEKLSDDTPTLYGRRMLDMWDDEANLKEGNVAEMILALYEEQQKIEKALEQQGIINLEDNQ